ncbi:MAG: D-amino acid dehydrogenase [Rhodospirillales bacterium]
MSNRKPIKVLVLGAGVVGVTSAYFLAKAGHDVIIIDRQSGAAGETSFANGGQISPSHTEPWAGPDTLGHIFRWIGRQDAPLKFRIQSDPGFLGWCLKFLSNCRTSRAMVHREHMLRLSLYSRNCLIKLREETSISYHARQQGILHFYRNSKDLIREKRRAEQMVQFGCPFHILDRDELAETEPAFEKNKTQIEGGLYFPDDESGDAHFFTQKLVEISKNFGVKFRFDTNISQLIEESGSIVAVETDKGTVSADAIVLAMGSYSPALTRPLGLNIPVQPIKGYSITLPIAADQLAPKVSLVDSQRKLVFSRFGNRLRVAGMAETAGFDTSIDAARAQSLLKTTVELFPDLEGSNDPEYWTGLRPLTPDNAPVIGATKLKNLYVNTGHGALGWTMSCGSGQIIADMISDNEPTIDLEGLTMERFS